MPCRRCSECRNNSHHWTPDPLDPDDDHWEPGDYACKHCDQRGKVCPSCDELGVVAGDGEEVQCPTCNGEGVLPLTDEEYDHEFYARVEE